MSATGHLSMPSSRISKPHDTQIGKKIYCHLNCEQVRWFDPPGRFLKEVPVGSGIGYEIGDKVAIRKTGQALRENSSEYRNILFDAIAMI